MRKYKYTLVALMGICAMLFSSCAENESRELPYSISIPESDLTSSVNQSTEDSASTGETEQTSSFEEITEPDVYIWMPKYDTGIHDFTIGNALYNSNTVYPINQQYYANLHADNSPAVLCSGIGGSARFSLDRTKAAEYAQEHWNDNVGLCAHFASTCLNAGGANVYSTSSTALALKLMHTNAGFGQFISVNNNRTVNLPEYAAPGDIVQFFCPYDGMPHSLVYIGNDEDGQMLGCSHNPTVSADSAYKVWNYCPDCRTPISEVFFFHFYDESDEELPAEVTNIAADGSRAMIYESKGYRLSAAYNRQNAVSCAKNHPADGIGERGAANTSIALVAGGIPVEHSFQSALFFQLVKSRLCSAQCLTVNGNHTVTLPEYARAGDVGFIYCRNDGMMLSSFIIDGVDEKSRMIALSYDNVNNGTSAFLTDEICPGCGSAIDEVVLCHFD